MTSPSGAAVNVHPQPDVEARVVRKLFWRLLPFLFLLYIVNYLDRINVGFAALQMRSELGFSDKVFGTGFGIFFVGYFFLQVPSNLALTWVGARRWITVIMVLWGVVSTCMIFVRTPHSFYVLRFVLGAAEAGFFPGIILYLKSWFPARARARAFAWFMTANPLAGVIGGPLSGTLLGLHGYGMAGWQWMFILEGVPAIALAAVVLFTVNDRPQEAAWLRPEEKVYLEMTLEQEKGERVDVSRADFLSILALSWRILLLTIVYFGLTASAYGIILWMPNYIHSLSTLSNVGIGIVSVFPYIVTAGGMVLVGMHSDRTGKHRVHLAGTAFAAAGFLFVAAHTSSIVSGLAFVALALTCTFSMQGPFWATATSLARGTTAAAAVIAVINSFGNLGGYYGPYIIGARRSSGGGFREGMLIISAFLALAGILAFVVRTPSQRASSLKTNPLQ